MNQITCKKCGTAFADTRRTCPGCGAHPQSRTESRSLPRMTTHGNQAAVKAQWQTLKSTAIGLAISGGLTMLFNGGDFNFLIMLLFYFFGYYISFVKRFIKLRGILGTLLAVVLASAGVMAVGALSVEFKIIGTLIMLALLVLPFAQGVALPVWNLVQYRKAASNQ